MEGGCCLPCGSLVNGEEEEEEEEETKSSSDILLTRTVPSDLDLPSNNGGADHVGRLANGPRKRQDQSHESKHGPQDRLLGSSRYTSLKDLLPLPSLPSPTAAARPQGGEISIRNRLVKQAAYAYLQPTGAPSPRSSRSRGCLRRVSWDADGCFGFIGVRLLPAVRQTFGRLLAGLRRRPVND